MKRHTLMLSAMILALAVGAAIGQDAVGPQEPAVVAQDLQKLRAAGRFSAVLWTRRTTLYTMQVVLPRPGDSRVVRTELAQPGEKPQLLEIDIWLLRADGTKIPATGRWESANFNKLPSVAFIRGPGPEVLFAFPLSAAREAVTAVMLLNGQTYVETLQPFKDQAR